MRNIRGYKYILPGVIRETGPTTIHTIRFKLIEENRVLRSIKLWQLNAAVDQLVHEGKIVKHGKILSLTDMR